MRTYDFKLTKEEILDLVGQGIDNVPDMVRARFGQIPTHTAYVYAIELCRKYCYALRDEGKIAPTYWQSDKRTHWIPAEA